MSEELKNTTPEATPKKKLHRRFFTVKRIILLSILTLLVIYLLVYFLGGYKAVAIEADTKAFTTDGFVSYETYYNEKEAIVREHVNAYAEKVRSYTNEQIVENLATLEADIWTKEDATALKDRVDRLSVELMSAEDRAQKSEELDSIKTTIYDYARILLDEFLPALETESFIFYFNRLSTQFKIEAVERNADHEVVNVLNTWYSNPQNGGVDEFARGGNSTINLQRSPILISYFTRSGSINQLTSYEYAISDQIISGNEIETVTPSFEIKYDEETKAVQVYYTFEKKGIKYSDFPKFISDDRWDELFAKNEKFVNEQLDQLKEYYDNNDLKSLQSYVDLHKDKTYIQAYLPTLGTDPRNYVGYVAYNSLMKDEGKSNRATLTNYLSLINQLESDSSQLEMLYKLACEMVRVEYKTDYKPSEGQKTIDTVYLKQVYNVYYDTDAAIANGHNIGSGYRECSEYSLMKRIMRNNLYQIFYERFRYTEEELENDQELFDVVQDDVISKYQVAIEYKLTDNGLEVTVLADSITESNPTEYPICKIDVLPYFTSAPFEIENGGEKYATSGCMVIPDGSGAVISLNNGKTDYAQYSKKVYTTDLAFGYEVKPVEQKDILLPMYAITGDQILDTSNNIVQNGYAIIARATKGAAQATLNANVSKYYDSYNKAYFTVILRESQAVKIGTGYYAKDITKFTEKFCQTDFVIEYSINNQADSQNYTYSDIAKLYQKMLLNDGSLDKANPDTTDDTVVNIELLGVYDYKDNFLGIVYKGHDTMTTFGQAKEIMQTLKEWGASNINLMYLGWRKSGLINETFKNMKFASKLGNKKEYNALLNYLKEEDITLYPVTSFMEINKYQDLFGKNRYSTRDISSEYTKKYPYDLASNTYDKKANAYYTLSPKFYQKFAEMLTTNFKKANPDLEAMAVVKLGGKLAGDYKKHSQYFKYNSVNEQINALEIMQKGGINKISLTAPYEFAVKYATNITELPYESTLKEVFDYSIPFYQLVFSGYRDYSGEVINANDEKSITSHLMNIYNTGSNIAFTFSYDNSSELIQTNYNYYYYTQYSQWETEVKTVLSELAKYHLYEYVLISHERYEGHNGVYVVTYAKKADVLATGTSTDTFKVYLNYSDKEISGITVKSGTIDLPRWNYYVDKEVS